MAVSTGPTGDDSVVPEQDAVSKFKQWLHENEYEDAVEVCPYDGREGGYQGAVDAWDVVHEYIGECEEEPSSDEYDALIAYAADIGQFADPKIWGNQEHEDECDAMADSAEAQWVHTISTLMYEYGVWTWGDPTAHQLEHIPPHGCSFVEWLHSKKCTKDFGATTRFSWTRPTQQLLAEFLASDSSKQHISATDAEQLTAWVAEKMAKEVRMDVSPTAEELEKYRMLPMHNPFEPSAQLPSEKCEGKTAKEWRDLYFQVLGQLHEQNAQLYSGDES